MYSNNDTIVSIATGPQGVIAIIRLSGKNCFEIAKPIVHQNHLFTNPKANITYLVNIIDENKNFLDKAMIITYLEPKSYTGQNMIEIFCHNSPYIVRKIIHILLKNGARQAEKGEFTFRAFLNGKLDLSQAEAINDLIKSETEKEHRIAVGNLHGKLSKKINNIKQKIIDLLADIEVRIDDTYEEMPLLDISQYNKKIENLEAEIKKLSDTFLKASYIKSGIKVAIVGAPNCGKSTLLNKILGYERAITSPIAGTTRDTIEEKTEINGFKFVFIDTAGIRKTDDPVELEGIKRTENIIKKSNIVLFLKDITEINSQDNIYCKQIIDKNISQTTRVIEVLTKLDLKPSFKDNKKLAISSITGKNIDNLLLMLTNEEEKLIDDVYDEIITSERHYNLLLKAVESLSSLKKNINTQNYEIMAEDLRQCLADLESIIGKTTSDDILKSIFSNFCVGK